MRRNNCGGMAFLGLCLLLFLFFVIGIIFVVAKKYSMNKNEIEETIEISEEQRRKIGNESTDNEEYDISLGQIADVASDISTAQKLFFENYECISNKEVGKYIEHDGEFSFKYSYDSVIDGAIGYLSVDFELDGLDEVLVSRITDDAIFLDIAKFNPDKNEYVKDSEICVGSIDLYDAGMFDIMLYYYNDKKYIVTFSRSLACLMADGEGVDIKFIGYDTSGFYVDDEYSYAGSDGMEDEVVIRKLRNYGIDADWNDLFGATNGLSDMISEKEYIARIYLSLDDFVGYDSTFIRKRFGTLYIAGSSEEDLALISNINKEKQLDSEYILPQSNIRYLSTEDIAGLTKEECRIARNEILARYGRKFKDVSLQEYFNSKSWYFGYIEPGDFNENIMTDIERENMYMIQAYENSWK